jgi:hypothetical protein
MSSAGTAAQFTFSVVGISEQRPDTMTTGRFGRVRRARRSTSRQRDLDVALVVDAEQRVRHAPDVTWGRFPLTDANAGA